MSTPNSDDAPTDDRSSVRARGAQACEVLFKLLVLKHDDTVDEHLLPAGVRLTVGRSRTCDIQIKEPSVSRTHATLLLGPPLVLEDLGSVNGCLVQGTRVAAKRSVEIATDEVFGIGFTTVLVQRVSDSPPPIHDPSFFKDRLTRELLRARVRQGRFAVLRIRIDGGANRRIVDRVLVEAVRSVDIVGDFGDGKYGVLLLSSTPEQAAAVHARIAHQLDEHHICHRIELACYPRDKTEQRILSADGWEVRRQTDGGAAPPHAIIAGSAWRRLNELMVRIANSAVSVLILGETGVGKEVVAEMIHRHSRRADQAFLCLNCSALSESVLESDLFGHEKGAFTGATRAKVGLLESARGGTVFLDEVGELPLSVQVKLLRVIEQRQVLPVGAIKPRDIDVRFLSATNRDLETEIARGTFRQDLYFRLNGVTLSIPPLRDRVSEIQGLATSFLDEACGRSEGRRLTISPEVLRALEQYQWPGNVRELRNVIERAALLCTGETVLAEHIAFKQIVAPLSEAAEVPRPATTLGAEDRGRGPLREAVEALQRNQIVEALQRYGGNHTRTAKALGIARNTLIARMDQFGIPRRKGRADNGTP